MVRSRNARWRYPVDRAPGRQGRRSIGKIATLRFGSKDTFLREGMR